LKLRSGILKFHTLSFADFGGPEGGFEMAMQLIKKQRDMILGIEEKHPDLIMGNELPLKLANQYWYCMSEG
jgi:hypothetical protein